MERKTLIWMGAGVGATVGGLVPSLFGVSWTSPWGVLVSTAGGLLGIWAAFKATT